MVLLPGLHAGLGIPGAHTEGPAPVPAKLVQGVHGGCLHREKRHVVCSIWDQVLQKLPSMQLEAGRAVRVDLGHEDCPASPRALFKEVPDTPSNASWDVIPANKPAITKMAADEVPPPRGPRPERVPPKLTACTYWTQRESQWGAAGGRDRSRFRSWRSRTSMLSRRCTWDAPDVSGISPSRARGWPWRPTQHRTPRPPSPSPRTPTRAWTLSRTRRRSSSRKLSEGWIAQVPRALTRFPPCLKARRQGERAQVPRALIRPPRQSKGPGAWRPGNQGN